MKKQKMMLLMVAMMMVVSMMACGQKAEQEAEQAPVVEQEATACEQNGHIWEEATCSAPKTCSVCGETEGETLEHTLTEANYQEASVCEVCGETVGEPLKAAFEEEGVVINTEIGKEYDFEYPCYRDPDKTTVAKIILTNYQTFDSDDDHPAKDGYEWQTVENKIIVGDENAKNYGFAEGWSVDDYYSSIGFNSLQSNGETQDGHECLTLNYKGKDYTECIFYVDENSAEWKEEEQYGWKETFTLVRKITVLVPKGYDGLVVTVSDTDYTGQNWSEINPERYLCFRVKE